MGVIIYFVSNPPAYLGHAGFSKSEMGANIFQFFACIFFRKKHFYISAQSRFFSENGFYFIKYILKALLRTRQFQRESLCNAPETNDRVLSVSH